MLKFGIHMDNYLLYCGIEKAVINEPSVFEPPRFVNEINHSKILTSAKFGHFVQVWHNFNEKFYALSYSS